MSHFSLGYISSGSIPGNDAFTKVLLHLDGANGSTTFTDVNAASLSNTWSSAGGATLTTAGAKFGPSCLTPNNSFSGWISTPYKSDFDIASNDFCVDFWFNKNGSSWSPAGLAGFAIDSGTAPSASQQAWAINLTTVSSLQRISVDLSNGSSVATITGTANVSSGWHHIALTRQSGATRLFVDGVLDASTSSSFPAVNGSLHVGIGYNQGFPVQGCWIDEFRLSVGAARWTSNFTPPTGPYT